jgi:hypothetical protein
MGVANSASVASRDTYNRIPLNPVPLDCLDPLPLGPFPFNRPGNRTIVIFYVV